MSTSVAPSPSSRRAPRPGCGRWRSRRGAAGSSPSAGHRRSSGSRSARFRRDAHTVTAVRGPLPVALRHRPPEHVAPEVGEPGRVRTVECPRVNARRHPTHPCHEGARCECRSEAIRDDLPKDRGGGCWGGGRGWCADWEGGGGGGKSSSEGRGWGGPRADRPSRGVHGGGPGHRAEKDEVSGVGWKIEEGGAEKGWGEPGSGRPGGAAWGKVGRASSVGAG